ncbi:MAG: hypothetical protein Q7S20_10825 [Gemmatimonadaceae bacterium]|nr:hypothetical protein [Gemmatimonadaceae bacterium]
MVPLSFLVDDITAFGTVAVSSSIVALGLAFVYWFARTGFDNPLSPVLRAAGLALLLLNAPYALRRVLRGRFGGYWWATSYSFLWLLTIAATAALGWIVPLLGVSPFVPLAAAGALTFVLVLVGWLRRRSVKSSIAMILGSAVFSTWAAGVVWGRIYKSPLFMEMLTLDGMVHHDGVTLAALGNMLRTYHVASVGLDGLPHMAYHWGTPWLFAQWSKLAGLSLMQFYQLAFPVTMIPFFFGAVIAFAIELRSAAGRDPSRDLAFWGVFLAATIGVMPITGMDALGVWTSNLMISESYTVAIPVALLLLATVVLWWRTRGEAVMAGHVSVSDYALLFLLVPGGLSVLGYLKISLMVLGFGAAAYAALRVGAYRRWQLGAAALLAAAVVVVTYGEVSLLAHREGVIPFDFLKGFVPVVWWPFFLLVHLFWSLVYVVLRLRQEGTRTVGDLIAAVRGRSVLDVEVVVVVALAGVVPGLLLHIDGGSAFYFSDVQRWLALSLLLAGSTTLIPRVLRWRKSDLRIVGVAFLALPLAISMIRNTAFWTNRMMRANAATRHALYSPERRAQIPEGLRALPLLADPDQLEAGLRRARNYAAVQGLLGLDLLPLQEKRRTALFIPQADQRYWTILGRHGGCAFSGYVAPALTGMAMIDGMPPQGCRLSPYYGLSLFAPRTRAQTTDDAIPPTLCARATRMGFDRVLSLRFDSAGRVSAHPIECRGSGL